MEDLFEKLTALSAHTVVEVVFEKRNGDERTMVCTREPKFYEDYEFQYTDSPVDESKVLPVWDLGVGDWRSIRNGSIISVEVFQH